MRFRVQRVIKLKHTLYLKLGWENSAERCLKTPNMWLCFLLLIAGFGNLAESWLLLTASRGTWSNGELTNHVDRNLGVVKPTCVGNIKGFLDVQFNTVGYWGCDLHPMAHVTFDFVFFG